MYMRMLVFDFLPRPKSLKVKNTTSFIMLKLYVYLLLIFDIYVSINMDLYKYFINILYKHIGNILYQSILNFNNTLKFKIIK
jgi:hypothetical protein